MNVEVGFPKMPVIFGAQEYSIVPLLYASTETL